MELATVQRRIALMEKYKEEIKIAKEALRQELESDELYQEAARKARETATAKKQVKDQIWSTPNNRKLLDDVLANTEEINTLQEILNEELMEYYQTHQTDEIPDEHGELLKLKVIVKLLPKKAY